jgi:hypothetical protein
MKKIKKIINIVFIGLILLSVISCDQEAFLETENKSNLTDVSMWASEGNADIYLNDIYSSIPNRNLQDPTDDFTADNDGGWYYTSRNWRQGIVNPSDNNYSVWFGRSGPICADVAQWPRTNEMVRKCNMFIQNVNENSENFSAEWIAKRIDEAKFLRAWFYGEMFCHLGGIVIHEVPLDRKTMTEDELYKPRLTFEETANWLINEFGTIVSNGNLPVKYNSGDPDAGRATLGAALAYKGWVELWIASEAFNSADPAIPTDPNHLQSLATPNPARWATAAATFKQFIDNYGPDGTGDYDLYDCMKEFWFAANEYNCEVIWDRQFVAYIMGNNYEQYGGPVWILNSYYTWGNYCPTQEMVDEYQMANGLDITDPASGYDDQNPYVGREQRFYDFIVHDGAEYYQPWMTGPDTIYTRIDLVNPSLNEIDYGGDDVGNTAYYWKKRINPLAPRGGNSSGQNYVFRRYAEILLSYAEAQNEAVGPDASVYKAINAIRTRSGTDLPVLPAGLSQAEMRDAIRHERRIELCWEGRRFFDVIRWKIADVELNLEEHGMTITNSVPEDNSGVWVYTKTSLLHPHYFETKMYFCPIAQQIIDQNSKVVQNYGY